MAEPGPEDLGEQVDNAGAVGLAGESGKSRLH